MLTKIFDLSCLSIACLTEVVEENYYLEVVGNNATLIFPNIFRTKLEFARKDVALSLLDESSIKHYSEERCVAKAMMLKDYLYVPMKRAYLLLLST